MFSVLSRLAKPGDGKKFSTPAPMSTSLQKKFGRGVDYNMKILIKGDRNVGKSCLLQRLQGGNFIEEYQPTDQIQVAPIHWKYKDTEHIIKVEVWEVVDKGKVKKKSPSGLKFDNALAPSGLEAIETPALDATFLDVYLNANGVIMMMDITKVWTFEYIKREIETVPPDLPIIILGNHCDMHHHREVDSYQIEVFISSIKQNRSGPIRYAESSMRNGFGLRLLHKFFNIPFLKLQRQTLINQLAVNDQEILDANKELDEFENSEGADYNIFIDRLASKRKQDTGVNSINPHRIASDKSPSIVLGAGKPIIPPNMNPLAQSNFNQIQNKTLDVTQTPKPATNNIVPTKNEQQINHSQISPQKVPNVSLKSKDDLDDFCAGVLDHSFLDDFSPVNKSSVTLSIPNTFVAQKVDSESDGETGANPLVVGVQDDLDSADDDDKTISTSTFKPSISNNNIRPNEVISKTSALNLKDVVEPFSRPVPKFTPFNETIINGIQSNFTENNHDNKHENLSMYKIDNLNTYNREVDDNQYDSGPDFAQPPGYDSTPSWALDADVRRSPEGGEGVSPSTETKKERKSEDKKHKKSKKSKDGDRSKEKDKTKSKDKDKKHKEKKHKKKSSDDNLEEFLGGPLEKPSLESYEAV